jgi:nucleoside-diphosphate-sugar epimerase
MISFGHVPSKESSSKTFDSRLAVNAEGVVNLLNGLKFKRKRPFVIHFASALEPRTDTQESESIYVGLKALGTEKFRQALHKREILGTCLSIHNVYGPNQPKNRFVANCIIDLASGKNIFLEYPMRVRDFIFIEDFVEDVILILKLAMKSPSLIKHDYEIGTGEGNSILSVAGLIASFLGVGASRISYNSDYLDLNPVIVADTRNLFRQVSRTQIFSGISKTLEG